MQEFASLPATILDRFVPGDHRLHVIGTKNGIVLHVVDKKGKIIAGFRFHQDDFKAMAAEAVNEVSDEMQEAWAQEGYQFPKFAWEQVN